MAATSRSAEQAWESLLSRAAFEDERSPACILSPEGIIVAVNRAWDEFAMANGGPSSLLSGGGILGTSFVGYVLGSAPRALVQEAIDHALAEGRGPPGPHPPRGRTYQLECNSPTLRRELSARFVALASDGEVHALLVIYTPLAEGPHGPTDGVVLPWPGADEFILQCSGCRRVADPQRRWWFVPEFVERPRARVSHGMCELCAERWYGAGVVRP